MYTCILANYYVSINFLSSPEIRRIIYRINHYSDWYIVSEKNNKECRIRLGFCNQNEPKGKVATKFSFIVNRQVTIAFNGPFAGVYNVEVPKSHLRNLFWI